MLLAELNLVCNTGLIVSKQATWAGQKHWKLNVTLSMALLLTCWQASKVEVSRIADMLAHCEAVLPNLLPFKDMPHG